MSIKILAIPKKSNKPINLKIKNKKILLISNFIKIFVYSKYHNQQ